MKIDNAQHVRPDFNDEAEASRTSGEAQPRSFATRGGGPLKGQTSDTPAVSGVPKPDPSKQSAASTLAQYNAYGKYASTIVRQLLFGESRFNNSKLVFNTVLSKLQVDGGFVPPGIRLGTLGLTRLNSAIANFSKAASLIASAAAKQRAGQDATDDIVSASAAIGQGLTESTAGLGADFGNYLVKQWQTALSQTGRSVGALQPPTPSTSTGDVIHEAGTDAPIPQSAFQSDVEARLAHLPPMSPQQHEDLMKQGMQTYNATLDEQLNTMRAQEKQKIIAELEKTPDGRKPARLVELSAQAEARLDAAEQLATAAKQDLAMRKAQDESDYMQMEKESNDIREQLKSGKYTDPDVASLSAKDAADRLGARLLSYRRREEEHAQSFEILAEDTPPDLAELGKQFDAAKSVANLETLTQEEKVKTLEKLKADYRTQFMKYQNVISEPTANLPEWLKISPALKAQIGPAALNTAFAAADFGARIDDYIRKVKDGSLTEGDRLRLAGSTIGMIGGMASFIPIVGPFVSIGLAITGICVGNLADQLAESRQREAANALRDEAVDEYLKKHPEAVNYVYKSDVGSA
ncbi:hypothetical protein [Paraburkholderia humisilvae]|uniref:Uncharacterized protein n=1 Tax=Paraburkholderia humisilvae TaxID=627669 RepID=A0A6J5F6F2_9BURK|nr:hypothetical protein [Paraburkholderia humisilvae]CAB3772905.1 hypothetical protein LMG29542_07024 [Paraburkholderia humisilvae]